MKTAEVQEEEKAEQEEEIYSPITKEKINNADKGVISCLSEYQLSTWRSHDAQKKEN